MIKTYIQQLKGPFNQEEELSSLVNNPKNTTIFKFGICTKPNHQIMINDKSFLIGKTGLLEVRESFLKSLYFLQDEDANSFIDIMAE